MKVKELHIFISYFINFDFKCILFDSIGEARARKAKKTKAKRPTRKSIFEIYEPSELKRGHFTDLDNEVSFLHHVQLFSVVSQFNFFFFTDKKHRYSRTYAN